MHEQFTGKKTTIRKKLILIIMGITTFALVASTIVSGTTEYLVMRQGIQENLDVTAEITAKNIVSALDFADVEAATQNLQPLSYESGIQKACIYNTAGEIFAQYKKASSKTFCARYEETLEDHENWQLLHITMPVGAEGNVLGSLHILYSLNEDHLEFFRQELIIIIIMLMALALAYGVTMKAEKMISRPVTALAEATRHFTRDKDFSIRADKLSEDELGDLVDDFNAMMDGMERRDQELVKARWEADNANEMKGQFLATMSHEIRTPMTGILGMAELLLGSKLESRQEGHARTIVSSAESLLNIINDILDFSKIEAGKLELDSTSVDMLELVDDIGLLYSVQAREKAVELVVHYQPGTEQFIFADPVRLRQIISNLISNAIKFTDKGHIVLSVSEDPDINLPDDKAQLLVQIKDTGVGMPSAVQEKIFEKFSQADASTTRKFGGTGLGLAICKSLVEMMGGSLWVESTEDSGSTFSFSIPCTRNHNVVDKAQEQVSLKGIRILIVDDLHINLKLISEQLESVGARCDVSLNGEDALRKMEKAIQEGDPFQISILDYLMPEMNGEMLACAIKDNLDMKECCLIMLTAAGNPIVGDTFAEKGFSAHMAKPVQQHVFIEGVAHVWGKYNEGFTDVLIRVDMHSQDRDDEASPVLEGVKILMAEDNLVNQVFIQEIVEEMQCDLTIVQNGQEAIDIIQKETFDLILMDCLMPVMDGFEATAVICKLKNEGVLPKGLPIIALTANAMKGDREKCLVAGMDEYLSKPIRKKELQETIYQWVTGKEINIQDETAMEETESNKEHQAEDAQRTVSEELLDQEAVESARSILKGKYDAMVTVYLDNSRERIEEITQAVKANDTEGVIRPAHTLKSTSKQMGALKLSDMAKDIELIAKALEKGDTQDGKDIAYISRALEDLSATLSATQRAFESMAA